MKPANALGLNGGSFKTEDVGERVVQQLWEPKGLKTIPPRTITAAGANSKRAVASSKENSALFSGLSA
jgi:hypothetical protein